MVVRQILDLNVEVRALVGEQNLKALQICKAFFSTFPKFRTLEKLTAASRTTGKIFYEL
jgi:hypothetical protein